MAAAGDDGIRLWDLKTRRRSSHHRGSEQVSALALSADGGILAVAGHGFLALCDTATGQITERWKEEAKSLAFTPGGGLVMLDKQGLVRIRDEPKAREARIVGREVSAMSLSADGKTVAMAVGGDSKAKVLELHDLESGRLIRSLDLAGDSAFTIGGIKLAISPDGSLVAAATSDMTRIWESTSGRLIHTLTRHENIHSGDNATLAFLAGPGRKSGTWPPPAAMARSGSPRWSGKSLRQLCLQVRLQAVTSGWR